MGRSLLDYTIEAFVRAGISELVLVIGYKGEMIRRYLGDGSRFGVRVEYAFNHNHQLGSAFSIQAAQAVVARETFILAMADHMISSQILKALLAMQSRQDTLCVDRQASALPQVKDATRVWVNRKGYISHIGKKIEPWNAIDTGVFRFTPHIFTAIPQPSYVVNKKYGISDAITCLIEQGHGVLACEVSGAFWMDVDTMEDLRYVENLMRGYHSRMDK
jgi:choline kinase